MFTAKILGVEKEHLQDDDSDILAVRFELSDGDESAVYKEGFPLDTSHEDIEAAVQARLRLYRQEKKRTEELKESEEQQAQADLTISKLEGKTFKVK